MNVAPLQPDALAGALRQAVRLRDRVIVVEVSAPALESELGREGLAESIALGRSLGMRFIIVTGVQLEEPLRRFVAAVAARGEKMIPLPALGIVTLHPIPNASPLVVVDPTLLVQLAALGGVPVLFPPVTDATGEELAFDVALIGAALAGFTDAALRVIVGPTAIAPLAPAASAEIAPSPGFPRPLPVPTLRAPDPTPRSSAQGMPALNTAPARDGRPIIVVNDASPERLLVEILKPAPAR